MRDTPAGQSETVLHPEFNYAIIGLTGDSVQIGGTRRFSFVTADDYGIKVFIDQSVEYVRQWTTLDLTDILFMDKLSAVTEITRPRTGVGFGSSNSYVAGTKYFHMEESFEIIDEKKGYRIFEVRR